MKTVRIPLKLHKRGPRLQMAGHPFPLLLVQPRSALLSTAQAGGPPSVKIGWATKTIIFEDIFHLQILWAICSSGNFFQPTLISENYPKFASEDRGC